MRWSREPRWPALVDHTLLKPEATEADVAALVAEAAELGVFAVCVSPSMVSAAHKSAGSHPEDLVIATVVGFPSGKHLSVIKAAGGCGGGRRPVPRRSTW